MRIPMNRGFFFVPKGLIKEAKRQGCKTMPSQSRLGVTLAVPPLGVTIKMSKPVEFGGKLRDGPHLVVRDVVFVKSFTKIVAGSPVDFSVWDVEV